MGTSLVNTVVNTGTPIPSGGSLWPPPPFTTCKPIRLRLDLPQVEIRINELSTDAAGINDDPTDDYVTWAPTFARARLNSPVGSAVTVVLTNDAAGAIPGGGDVQFAAHTTPWPVNTTATNDTLTLSLPADGSWVPFVIAGKFGTPSTNDKDTIVEAHMSTAGGPVLGRKALMVRVRKNANNLTASERDRFLFAWRNFRNQLGSNYVLFQEMHRLAATAGTRPTGNRRFSPGTASCCFMSNGNYRRLTRASPCTIGIGTRRRRMSSRRISWERRIRPQAPPAPASRFSALATRSTAGTPTFLSAVESCGATEATTRFSRTA